MLTKERKKVSCSYRIWLIVFSGAPFALTSTHLLGNHDNTRSLDSAAQARHCEQFHKPDEHVVLLGETGLTNHLFLPPQLGMDHIKIPGCLQRSVPQSEEGSICLLVILLRHQPAWRLWAEPDSQKERYSRDKGRAQLQPPSDITSIGHYQIRARAEEDTEGCPKLP
jgi:hypothetical protein